MVYVGLDFHKGFSFLSLIPCTCRKEQNPSILPLGFQPCFGVGHVLGTESFPNTLSPAVIKNVI